MEVTILGSGTSSGVPTIGCACQTCISTDPRDKRLRPSIWIRKNGRSLVIDTSSDFRQQCLTHSIRELDAIIYTHHHFDHISGFDDLRAFNFTMKKPVPIYAMPETLGQLRRIFSYSFAERPNPENSAPKTEPRIVQDEPFDIEGIAITPLPLQHGSMRVNGYRIGSLAYCTDCNFVSPNALELMRGIKILIIDALRFKEHPTHFSLIQAIEMAETIGAESTYLTHIAHDMKHEETDKMLPQGIRLAYDGLSFNLPDSDE